MIGTEIARETRNYGQMTKLKKNNHEITDKTEESQISKSSQI